MQTRPVKAHPSSKEKSPVPPTLKSTSSGIATPIGKFKVQRDKGCTHCGLCAELCRRTEGVISSAWQEMLSPQTKGASGFLQKNDIIVSAVPPGSPSDGRSTRTCRPCGSSLARRPPPFQLQQAETGGFPLLPIGVPDRRSGEGSTGCGCGSPGSPGELPGEEEVSTALLLTPGRWKATGTDRGSFYGGGMSFGSVSNHTMISGPGRRRAWDTFTCTGRGG